MAGSAANVDTVSSAIVNWDPTAHDVIIYHFRVVARSAQIAVIWCTSSKATGISSTPFLICISQWRLVGTVHVINAIGITRMMMCFQSAVVGAAMLVRCLDLVAGSRWNDGGEAKDYGDAGTTVNLCTYASRYCRAKFT
jgi:hypothetical protein